MTNKGLRHPEELPMTSPPSAPSDSPARQTHRNSLSVKKQSGSNLSVLSARAEGDTVVLLWNWLRCFRWGTFKGGRWRSCVGCWHFILLSSMILMGQQLTPNLWNSLLLTLVKSVNVKFLVQLLFLSSPKSLLPRYYSPVVKHGVSLQFWICFSSQAQASEYNCVQHSFRQR